MGWLGRNKRIALLFLYSFELTEVIRRDLQAGGLVLEFRVLKKR